MREVADPMECAEEHIERWFDEHCDGDVFDCPECGAPCPLSDGIPATPSPFSHPICPRCAEPLYPPRAGGVVPSSFIDQASDSDLCQRSRQQIAGNNDVAKCLRYWLSVGDVVIAKAQIHLGHFRQQVCSKSDRLSAGFVSIKYRLRRRD